MTQLIRIPKNVENFMGAEVSESFFQFLQQALINNYNDIIKDVNYKAILKEADNHFTEKLKESQVAFEKEITDTKHGLEGQISTLRVEMHEKFSEMHGKFSEMHEKFAQMQEQIGSLKASTSEQIGSLKASTSEQIGSLKASTAEQIAGIHKEITQLHKENSLIHKQIALQTRWILVAILGATILFPVVSKIVDKF